MMDARPAPEQEDTTTRETRLRETYADALRLWSWLFGDQQGVWFALLTGTRTATDRALKAVREKFFRWPDQVNDALIWIKRENEEEREVYFCAHLLTAPKRKKEHAAPLCALYADLDHDRTTVQGVPEPSLVVESSPGKFQTYWLLSHAVEPAKGEHLNKRLAAALNADPSGADLTQILRVPGTINHKYPGRPIVRLVQGSDVRHDPDELDRTFPPLVQPTKKARLARIVQGVPTGERNTDAASMAGSLLARYAEREWESTVWPLLEGWNARNTPPLPREELRGVFESIAGAERAKREEREPPFTDLGNAERLVARHGADLRYCHPWHSWFVWDGRRWEQDATAEVERRAKETARALYEKAARTDDDGVRQDLAKHARRIEADARLTAMIDLAKSESGVPILPEMLDTDLWSLNCLNGTLDLRTAELRPHRPQDLITKIIPVEYRPEATAPTWLAFLERIMGGNADLIAFLQRAVGYSLTGDTSERVMFILHGGGMNGKTTFLETLKRCLETTRWEPRWPRFR